MNDFRNSRDSRPRPVYRDRRSQPGRPRNVPEALAGPEDEKNSFGAEKGKAGKNQV